MVLRTRLVWLLVRAVSFERLRELRRHRAWRLAEALLRRRRLFVLGGLTPYVRLDASSFDIASAVAYTMLTGTHEPMVQEALRRTVRRGDTILDLGAGIGYFTLIGAALVGPQGRVIAVDPVAGNVAAIEANAAANELTNVEVLRAAVGASAGEAEVAVTADAMWAVMSAVGDHPMRMAGEQVEVVSLDELIGAGRIPAPEVIKLDVEGSELAALDGMRGLLSERRPTLIAEMHATNGAFCERIEALGYSVENLDGPESPREAGPNIHVLCRARSSDGGGAPAAGR
jgi:FkbM family methyltransferase